jgi:hypothetical protein
VKSQVIQAWLQIHHVHDSTIYGLQVDIPEGHITYRLYLETENEDDFILSVFGYDQCPLVIETSTDFITGDGYGIIDDGNFDDDNFNEIFPGMRYWSYLTIKGDPEYGPSGNPHLVTAYHPGINHWQDSLGLGQDLVIDGPVGGAWALWQNVFDWGESGNDQLTMIGQFTTDGEINGMVNVVAIVNDDADDIQTIHGLEFGTDNLLIMGCTDQEAMNYNPAANYEDGSCLAIGDFDGDGNIGVGDLLLFLGNLGCVSDCGFMDLNGDGIVNIFDLLMLLGLL